MELFDLLGESQAALLLVVGLFSLMVGSFLNVVIHRLPLMMERDWREQCRELEGTPADPAAAKAEPAFNLVVPRSRCPHCGHQIRAVENIPILSYLFLRGRCAHCGGPISLRYPLVELATALLSLLVAWRFGFSWQTLAILPLTWALLALSLIDYDRQLLPDDIVLPFLWLGLLLSLLGLFTDPRSAILGAAGGYLALWSVFQLFKLITGKEGMGYGDFKLLALFGAWGGWEYLFQIILLSSVVGAVLGALLLTLAGRDRAQPIPFGPFLATAGWISLLWGQSINDAYFRWTGLG
jgi:leader peptidase (prepilin peptidase) / N-methyltransferase